MIIPFELRRDPYRTELVEKIIASCSLHSILQNYSASRYYFLMYELVTLVMTR